MTTTAVFGVDDYTSAYIEVTEAGDSVPIDGSITLLATIDIIEFVDTVPVDSAQGLINGVIWQPGSVAVTEHGDGCEISCIAAGVVPTAVSPNRYFIEIMGTDYTIEVKAPPIIVGELTE